MDEKAIQEFLEFTVNNPLPSNMNQEQCGSGKDYWNSDFWTMEVASCLFLGEDYFIPEKFKYNKKFSIDRIIKDAELKKSVYVNLQKIQNDTDYLLVCEVGRGLDILMANMVKKWKTIYCYDQVNYSRWLQYFDNIVFYHKSSAAFNPDVLSEDVIMIMNHSIYKPFENKNIIHAIVDGELKW